MTDVVAAIRRPSQARVWNWLLGGKDHFAVDRACFDHTAPETLRILRQLALHNEKFRQHAITRIAETTDIDQFIDCGPGLPPTETASTHDIVSKINPDARVVYVDLDPLVLNHCHCRPRPAGHSSTEPLTIEDDIFDPIRILDHPRARAFFDWSRPVAVIHTATWQNFDGGPGESADRMKAFVAELAPDSHTVISGFVRTQLGPTEDHNLGKPLEINWFNQPNEIEALFPEQQLLEPGLVTCREWSGSGPLGEYDPAPHSCLLGAIGRVLPRAAPTSQIAAFKRPPSTGQLDRLDPPLPERTLRPLLAAGYNTVADARGASDDELLQIHGIGPKALSGLRSALAARRSDYGPCEP